jgi:hypothetical protein
MSKPATSKEITERFIQLFNDGRLNYSEELQIFEAMVKRYGLMTITNYAAKVGKSYNGIKIGIEAEKIPHLQIDNQTFIISNL